MDSIVVDTERQLRVSAADARTVLLRFLRAQEFTITTEQVSMVSAKRGSQLAGSVQPRKLPVSLHATLQPTPQGCTVSIHLADAWRTGVGTKVWGMNGPYRTMMGQIQTALDDVLKPLAATGASFDEAEVVTSTRDVPLLSATNAGVVKSGGAVADKVDALLTPNDAHSTPKGVKEVVLRSSKGSASFDRMAVEGLFAVGLLVSTKPGAMPTNLARDVEAFAAKLEARVAEQPQGRVVCEVADHEIPVAEFLAKQAALREALPLRTLHVCTTCKFEKIVNPDFEKLQEKIRRKRALTGAVGATVSAKGVTPFLLVGSLLKLKNFDIPFVCPRCQGLEADSSIVTYCPQCGERRDEAVLRMCKRCQYNFAAPHHDHADDVWRPEEISPPVVAALPMPAAAPMALPAPTASGGTALPTPAYLSPTAAQPPGWYPDSTGRHDHRYWDGSRWTAHVSDRGVTSQDPL